MDSGSTSRREITVVAAVIRDAGGRVLLARRPDDSHMGGLWEFPGGKVENGEAPSEALVRELREELAVNIVVEHPMTFAVHEETGLRILLLFFAARIETGEICAREGQTVAWVPIADLPTYPTPPADAELLHLLSAGTIA
jgi:8-oxo-dGTP diphosphatase